MKTEIDKKQIIDSVKRRLSKEKVTLSVGGFLKYTFDEIEKALELINNNLFSIDYGKFEIKGISEKGKGIHILYSPENDASAGKGATYQNSARVKQIIEEEIVLASFSNRDFLFSEEEKKAWGNVLTYGTEARIYGNPENPYELLKVIDYLQQSKSIFAFFKRLEGFNYLFRETRYNLAGFIQESNILKPVIMQNFVPGQTLAEIENPQKHLKTYMNQCRNIGFSVDERSESISLNGYTAHDLNYDNIIWGDDGAYYVIDALVIPEKSRANEGFIVNMEATIQINL
jgi:hypothetical protein